MELETRYVLTLKRQKQTDEILTCIIKWKVLPFEGVLPVRDALVEANGCTPVTPEPEPNGSTAARVDYEGCLEGYPMTWVAFNGTHIPGYIDEGDDLPLATKDIWEFFTQFE